jgi:DNA-binding NarL/FixJ family response regulator
VVLTDLAMPDLYGASATRALLQRHPGLGVVVPMMHVDDEPVLAALRAAARGYLLEGADTAKVVGTVLAVATGHAVYGAAAAARIAQLSLSGGRREAFPELTQRERAALELGASGARYGHIGAMLGITDKTVRNPISAILWLQVSDRTAAPLKARDRGISGESNASG